MKDIGCIAHAYVDAISGDLGASVQCMFTESETHEMVVGPIGISSLRTTRACRGSIVAVRDAKRGTLSVSSLYNCAPDPMLLRKLDDALGASSVDEAYDVAPYQVSNSLGSGPSSPDMTGMFDRLKELDSSIRQLYPAIAILEASIKFVREATSLVNSNAVDLLSVTGKYEINLAVIAQCEGRISTPFDSHVILRDLSLPLLECGSLRQICERAVHHLDARRIKGSFTGDVIFSPDVLGAFMKYFPVCALGDRMLLAGTSVYKGKLDSRIAVEHFSLSSIPLSPSISGGYFLTNDGFIAENSTLIENGFLRNYSLSQYGARKTGLRHVRNNGGCLCVSPGNVPSSQLIESIDRGLLVNGFAGGYPSDSGDFSGTVPDALYIEKGVVRFPVKETMITGNIPKMVMAISGISREYVNFGNAVYPWMAVKDIFVSSK